MVKSAFADTRSRYTEKNTMIDIKKTISTNGKKIFRGIYSAFDTRSYMFYRLMRKQAPDRVNQEILSGIREFLCEFRTRNPGLLLGHSHQSDLTIAVIQGFCLRSCAFFA